MEVAGRRHAHPHQSARAVGKAQLHVRVVVRLPSEHQRGELGRDVRHLQAGDETGEVMGVRSDVADHRGLPGDAGRRPPGGLLVPAHFQERRGPARGVLHLDQADRAQLARADHLARLPHQRIAGVAVGDGEHEPGPAREPQKIEGVLELSGERLVADDVDAKLEEGPRDRVMARVWRHDRHHLDAVLARRLALGHLLPAAVPAFGLDLERGGEVAAPSGVGGKDARYQRITSVEAGGAAVGIPDVRAGSAADHAEAELAARGRHTRTPNSAISFCISRPPAIMSSTWSRWISPLRNVPMERPRLRSVNESPTG